MGAHDGLPPLSVGPKCAAVQADWRCQAWGHSCLISESCHIYCSSVAQNAFLLEEPLGMMPHSHPMITEQMLLPSGFQNVFLKEREPSTPNIKTLPFPKSALALPSELSLILGISSKPQFIKHHLQCFMPVPRAHDFGVHVRLAEPKSGTAHRLPSALSLLLCMGTRFCSITHGRIFWSLQGNREKETEFN